MDLIAELRRRAGAETRVMTVPAEVRAEPDAGGLTISGHAAVFDRLSEDLGGWREQIKRGAFRGVLDDDQDVRLLINHEPWPVLGRTKSRTLELSENPRGLRVYSRVGALSAADDLRVMLDRGDVDQMSFGFRVAEDEWHEDKDGVIVRTILKFERLFDVSIVTFPAYPQTDVSGRAATDTHDTGVSSELDGEELRGTSEPAPASDVTADGDAAATVTAGATPRRSLADAILRQLASHYTNTPD